MHSITLIIIICAILLLAAYAFLSALPSIDTSIRFAHDDHIDDKNEGDYGNNKIKKEVIEYVMANRPSMDKDIPSGYVQRNIELAIDAWNEMPWCNGKSENDNLFKNKVPFELFVNDVAPYAVLTERRDDWRGLFFQRMKEIISSSDKPIQSMKDVLLLLNRKSWAIVNPPIKFLAAKTNQLNNYAVFDTMRWSNASCTVSLDFFLFSSYDLQNNYETISLSTPTAVIGRIRILSLCFKKCVYSC